MITGIPGHPPIDDGAVIHDGAVILETGSYTELKHAYSGPVTDLGGVTIVPGLVNPHCHLKLSKLKGKTLSGQGFLSWMLSMMANDYRTTDFDAVTTAVGEARDLGICCFGDILPPRGYGHLRHTHKNGSVSYLFL